METITLANGNTKNIAALNVKQVKDFVLNQEGDSVDRQAKMIIAAVQNAGDTVEQDAIEALPFPAFNAIAGQVLVLTGLKAGEAAAA